MVFKRDSFYKISDLTGIDIKNELSIIKNNSEIIGLIKSNNNIHKYKLKSIEIDDLIITFNISDREQ